MIQVSKSDYHSCARWKNASDELSEYRRDLRRVVKGIGLDPDVYRIVGDATHERHAAALAGTHS